MKTIKKLFSKKSIKKTKRKAIKLIVGNELILGFSAGFICISILTITIF